VDLVVVSRGIFDALFTDVVPFVKPTLRSASLSLRGEDMANMSRRGRAALCSSIAGFVFGLCGTCAGIYFGPIRPTQQVARTLDIPMQSILLAFALLVGLLLGGFLLYSSVKRFRRGDSRGGWQR
jgi:hypothetical protein